MSTAETFQSAEIPNVGGSDQAVAAAMAIMHSAPSQSVDRFVEAQASIAAAPNRDVHLAAQAMLDGQNLAPGQTLGGQTPIAYADVSFPEEGFAPNVAAQNTGAGMGRA